MQPFSPAHVTVENRRVAGRRRGAARTGTPSPLCLLPFLSVCSSDGVAGQSISWPRDRRDSRMSGLRPTGLPHFALSPSFLPSLSLFLSSTIPFARPLTFHFETSTSMAVSRYFPSPEPFALTQETSVVVNS